MRMAGLLFIFAKFPWSEIECATTMMKGITVVFIMLPALGLAQEKDCSSRNRFRAAVCTASDIDAADRREREEAEERTESAKAAARRSALATKAAEKAQL